MLLSTGVPFSRVPESYVRPDTERPGRSEIDNFLDVPVIDMGSADSSMIVKKIADACRSFGFFQVINHGVCDDVMEKMMRITRDFFNMPVEEKMKLYSDDPSKTVRLSTSFNVRREKVHNWRDYLRLHCYPPDEHVPDWPANPPFFREVVRKYSEQVRRLGLRLEEDISEGLGLERSCLRETLREQGQQMAINYYPKCPEPELTYGLPSHTDPNVLTLLLPDPDVTGLQVLKGQKWLAVRPIQGAMVINIGDQLQALSNGFYKSVRHRAVVNSEAARISVATFLCPADDAVIASFMNLNGAASIYKSYTYREYYRAFWSGSLDRNHCLDLFKN